MPEFNFQFLVTVPKQTTIKSRVMQNYFCNVNFCLSKYPCELYKLTEKMYLRSIYVCFYILESSSSLEQWVFKLMFVWQVPLLALVMVSICTCNFTCVFRMTYYRTSIYCTYFLFGTYVQLVLLPRIQSQSLEKNTFPNTCLYITTNMFASLNIFLSGYLMYLSKTISRFW